MISTFFTFSAEMVRDISTFQCKSYKSFSIFRFSTIGEKREMISTFFSEKSEMTSTFFTFSAEMVRDISTFQCKSYKSFSIFRFSTIGEKREMISTFLVKKVKWFLLFSLFQQKWSRHFHFSVEIIRVVFNFQIFGFLSTADSFPVEIMYRISDFQRWFIIKVVAQWWISTFQWKS